MRKHCRFGQYVFGLAILSILDPFPVHCPADQTDLLSLVRAGHRSARESIRSFSASVTLKVNNQRQPEMIITGKYWRSLDVVRIQEKQESGTEDYLLKDGEIRQVGRTANTPRGYNPYAAARRASVETLSLVDVWNLMMIDFPGPNGGHYDFDRSLEFAKQQPQAIRERKDGHNCIRINLTVVSTRGLVQNETLWHDIDRNYLVWKKRLTYKGASDLFESEILEFSEPIPGVFVPMRCHRQKTRDSVPIGVEDITLSDVQVNKPIPQSVFQLPAIPSGAIVYDRIQRTKYPIDANWRPIGPTEPLLQMTMPSSSDNAGSVYHSQSTSEPVPFSRWLILASLSVLVIACSFLLYRQVRLRGRLQRPN